MGINRCETVKGNVRILKRKDSSISNTLQHRTETVQNPHRLLRMKLGTTSRLFVRKTAGMKSDIIHGLHGLTHTVRNNSGNILYEYDNL
jgi:hypothetical protein